MENSSTNEDNLFFNISLIANRVFETKPNEPYGAFV